MIMMIQQITQRLNEVNALLSVTSKQSGLSFEQALPLSQFYRDFSDTNSLIEEAGLLSREDVRQLLDISSSLLSETETYLALDRTPLQAVDFEALFEEHLKPFEAKYEDAKDAATTLWREYSAMSNRLDFLPLDSEEYKSLDPVCDAKRAEYDEAHARVNLSYNEWRQERDRYFCLYCFKPIFLDVLVERLQGIAGSIISDIRRMREGEP